MTPEQFNAKWGKVLDGEEPFEDVVKRSQEQAPKAEAAPAQAKPRAPRPSPSAEKPTVQAPLPIAPAATGPEKPSFPGMGAVRQFEDQNPIVEPPPASPMAEAATPFSFDPSTGVPGKILDLLKKAGLRDREMTPEEQDDLVRQQGVMKNIGMR